MVVSIFWHTKYWSCNVSVSLSPSIASPKNKQFSSWMWCLKSFWMLLVDKIDSKFRSEPPPLSPVSWLFFIHDCLYTLTSGSVIKPLSLYNSSAFRSVKYRNLEKTINMLLITQFNSRKKNKIESSQFLKNFSLWINLMPVTVFCNSLLFSSIWFDFISIFSSFYASYHEFGNTAYTLRLLLLG